MMTLYAGRGTEYCDRVSRRSFLGLGMLGFAGLSLFPTAFVADS